MQPAMAAAVREWVPKRSVFGTAVYTNGLIMGEIIPVATMLPFVLPYFNENWRPALGAWSLPLIATAIAVAMFVPKSAANAATRRVAGWLPRLNSRLNWRIGLTFGSITSTYFCLNGFLPACLNGNGRQDLISAALTSLNAGQVPASFLLLLTADKLQGKRWPYLMLGVLSSSCVVGIMTSASGWTVFWAGLAGFSLAPLWCWHWRWPRCFATTPMTLHLHQLRLLQSATVSQCWFRSFPELRGIWRVTSTPHSSLFCSGAFQSWSLRRRLHEQKERRHAPRCHRKILD